MTRMALIAVLALAGCDAAGPSSDQIQKQQQEQLSLAAAQQVGMPAITNFQEKRNLKMILELRDTSVATYTYTRDMQGKLHFICNSIGFGIPYATQYTNPQRAGGYSSSMYTLPQADPNGLFSPEAAEATWVLCLNPKTKEMAPTYVEDKLTVSLFEMSQ